MWFNLRGILAWGGANVEPTAEFSRNGGGAKECQRNTYPNTENMFFSAPERGRLFGSLHEADSWPRGRARCVIYEGSWPQGREFVVIYEGSWLTVRECGVNY